MKLDVYSVYTPINLVGVAVNWGATIGAYTMDIRQEYIGQDGGDSGLVFGKKTGFGRQEIAARRALGPSDLQ